MKQVVQSSSILMYRINWVFCQVHFTCLLSPLWRITKFTLPFGYFVKLTLIANFPSPFWQIPKSTLLVGYFVKPTQLPIFQIHIVIWLFCQVDLTTNFSSSLRQIAKSTLLFGYFAKST